MMQLLDEPPGLSRRAPPRQFAGPTARVNPAARGHRRTGFGILLLAAVLLWLHGCHPGGHEEDDLGLLPPVATAKDSPAP